MHVTMARIWERDNQISWTWLRTENGLQMLPTIADLVPVRVCVSPPFASCWGCWNSHLSPKVTKFSCSLGLMTISESHSEVQQPEQRATVTNYEYFNCLGSLHNFCCKMKEAGNLWKLLTSPNRRRASFFKCMPLKSIAGTVLVIFEMTKLSGADCKCSSLAGVWI